MGRAAASDISRELIAHGLSPATPVLIACDVSLPHERQVATRLDLLPLTVQTVADDRPTLILIGEAVAPSRLPERVATQTVAAI